MNKLVTEHPCWTICLECRGSGKKSRKFKKKSRLHFQMELEQYKKAKLEGKNVVRPNRHLISCSNCGGSGIIQSTTFPTADEKNYPHVAIIGGGIGGVALGVACLHRGIPFTIYERDNGFESRSQGYGLTLQQASKAMKELGLLSLKDGVNSTRHVVHTTEGKVIGEWGMRNNIYLNPNKSPKRTNIHIARQSLRLALLEQLGESDVVKFGYQLIDFKVGEGEAVDLIFQVDGEKKSVKADLVVGADGIYSTVRKLLIGEEITPLRYLGCMVILGICPLKDLEGVESSLLDSATVFQTANGNERIYIMPFTLNSVMWQLSFPIPEIEAKALSAKGALALKKEACNRTQWHNPIPQILQATKETMVTGYPAYDRELISPELLKKGGAITLIGDAAHPMSPFKGQGANQALLDALSLARSITVGCDPMSKWKENGIRKNVLTDFESEMIERSATKVKDSAVAAKLLHSETILLEGDAPRGRIRKKKDI